MGIFARNTGVTPSWRTPAALEAHYVSNLSPWERKFYMQARDLISSEDQRTFNNQKTVAEFKEGRRQFDEQQKTTRLGQQTQKDIADRNATAQETVAETQAGAQRDVAATQAGAQRDVATTQAGAQKYVAKTQAGATQYAAEQQAGAAKYAAEQQAGAAKYAADKNFEGVKDTNDARVQINENDNAVREKAIGVMGPKGATSTTAIPQEFAGGKMTPNQYMGMLDDAVGFIRDDGKWSDSHMEDYLNNLYKQTGVRITPERFKQLALEEQAKRRQAGYQPRNLGLDAD